VRTYARRAPYDPIASAQIRTRNQTNPQVTALGDLRTRNGDKSQVTLRWLSSYRSRNWVVVTHPVGLNQLSDRLKTQTSVDSVLLGWGEGSLT
jgi:hypothetical protein